jgi:serine/threonine protein kinase
MSDPETRPTAPADSGDRTIKDTLRRCEACGGTFTGPAHQGCPGGGPSREPTVIAAPPSRIDDLPAEARPHDRDPSRQLNQYVLVEVLGKGGMGEVWKAWDRKLTRWVAIKFLLGQTDEAILRFRREAKMAGRLNHPNVAAIHEVGEAPARQPGQSTVPFIAMQFVDGAALGKDPRPLREMVEIFIRAVQGVEHAHKAGVVHRDLKPANILVSREGWPYVMDFGLARPVEGESGLSVTGAVMGTPAFMPPEQVEGRLGDIGPASDVYSLGATMYAVLCGTQPFPGQTTLQVLQKVCNEAPVPPRRHNPEITPDLEAAILKAMSKKREDRHPSAAALADDLRRALSRLQAPAPSAPAPAPPARTPSSSLPVALATIFLFAAFAGAAAWRFFLRQKPVANLAKAEPAPPAPPEPARPEPAKAEPAKAEPARPPTLKPEPAKAEPAAVLKPVKPEPPGPAKPPPAERGLEGAGLTAAQVDGAIGKGARFLASHFRSGEPSSEADYLAASALLLSAGVDDPAAAMRLGRFLRSAAWTRAPRSVHAAALRAVAIEASGDPSLRGLAAECVQYLLEAQGPRGTWAPAADLEIGLPAAAQPAVFVYGARPLVPAPLQDLTRKGVAKDPPDGNPISTQHALLGLWAAERCGARAPREAWTKAVEGLAARGPGPLGSVTVSGLGGLALGGRALGVAPRGEAIEAGRAWLAANFAVDRDPGGEGAPLGAWLLALERAGTVLGTPFVGDHEWYPAGARLLVDRQRPDGSWVEGSDAVGPTAAAVLFLARATRGLFQNPPRGAPGEVETSVVGAAPNLMFLLDASGAMRMDLDGRERFDVAREIVAGVLEKLPEGAWAGLRVFGARRTALEPEADVDTQLVVAPGPLDRRVFKTQVDLLRVRGKAPLSLSLVEMAKDLEKFPREIDVSVVLLVDGRDSDRRANPVSAVAELAGSRRGVKIHVVGFNDEDDEVQERLARMAAAGGGRRLPGKGTKDLLPQVIAAAVRDDAFGVLDGEGRTVLAGRLGDRAPLPEGRYRFLCGPPAARVEMEFWVNARHTTRLFVDAARLSGGTR